MKAKILKFEDLIAWQKARAITKDIYELSNQDLLAKDYGLRDQIRRASVSIMSNIAEGFERGGRKEFYQFLVIAKASCAELRSQLYVACYVGYINNEVFRDLNNKCEEITRIIGGLRSSIQEQIEAPAD